VTWENVPASEAFWLDFAMPEDAPGAGQLTLRIGDQTMETFELNAPTPHVRHRRFDTAFAAGESVTVQLELTGSAASVLVDGGFEREGS
jgi:hypothetical protein